MSNAENVQFIITGFLGVFLKLKLLILLECLLVTLWLNKCTIFKIRFL